MKDLKSENLKKIKTIEVTLTKNLEIVYKADKGWLIIWYDANSDLHYVICKKFTVYGLITFIHKVSHTLTVEDYFQGTMEEMIEKATKYTKRQLQKFKADSLSYNPQTHMMLPGHNLLTKEAVKKELEEIFGEDLQNL
jgi:hypothetical protein